MQNDVRKKHQMSAEKKYAILEEIKQNKATKSKILRREVIYTTDVQHFEEIAHEGAIKALRIVQHLQTLIPSLEINLLNPIHPIG